ncbi:MAG: flavodoxin-dependent (E)-4-hydroxy-3-methylbut-2-enyl-diphosphate synthase [Desulfobacteraceae bacterium]|nr:flavodoxin-dependent (E)-4-hydroxy-3-methylbut-2-enyl-diphosphate synthase [Desulfobacteraceae bacterium]
MSLVQQRRPTRQICVGKIKVGSGAQVSVQSMTNTCTQDVDATVGQILSLEKAGCEIVRVAVPDMEAALAIGQIKDKIHIPLIADVHFDFRLALAAADAGADGLRINPGNIGDTKKIQAVVDAARAHGISIRVGVNAGSLEKEIEKSFGTTAEAMVESALSNIRILERLGFYDIKVSLKASDVTRTVEAYRMLAPLTDVPFHVGVTEAGGLYAGITKSAIGIGMLLSEGIGDTIRVSLTRDPVEEIRTGFEILRALGIRSRGPELISCPTCGRCKIDLFKIVEEIEKALLERSTKIKVAIMGCVVNGPGEAKEADIGIAGADGKGILFKKGKVFKKVDEAHLVDQLLYEIDKMIEKSEEWNGKEE